MTNGDKTGSTYKEGYRDGMSDAWEAARMCFSPIASGAFALSWAEDIIKNHSPSEVIETLDQYMVKKKADVKIGDEAIVTWDSNIPTRPVTTIVITKKDEYGVIGISPSGSSFRYGYEHIEKTGRHFPQIEEILQQMTEENPK